MLKALRVLVLAEVARRVSNGVHDAVEGFKARLKEKKTT